jgi:hypothetical protein
MRKFWPCAGMLLWLASFSAWSQAPITESDMEWRKSPRPAIERSERKHTPITLPDSPSDTVTPIWTIESNDVTLSNTLSRWSRQEKWQLMWEADRDFPVLATVYLKGSFQSAILAVMQSLSDSDYPLQAILNPNTRVVRIVRYMQTPNG